MADLLELAERVLQATAPDRELDALIAVAVDAQGLHGEQSVREIMAGSPCNTIADVAKFWPRLERYTASIDAAITLIPNDEDWDLSKEGSSWVADFTCFAPRGTDDSIYSILYVHANTPALAICAAALRARHAEDAR